jgi:alkylated DNA nucleotide flippase Atl1
MSNKQSSLEWLISQLQKSKDWHRVLNEVSQLSSARIDIIEQAKAMHKEEMIEFADKMQIVDDVDFDGNVTFIFNPEQNYNETFGGGNK